MGCSSRTAQFATQPTRSRHALQATTMAAIDAAARLDRDWLSRGMSDPASLRTHALRYRELKGREITWVLPG
jgi:enoyl-CoA hydratase